MSYNLKILVSDPDSEGISIPIIEENIHAEAGADFTRRFKFLDTDGTALDLTGYSLLMQVRDVERTLILEWVNADFDLLGTGAYEIAKTGVEMDVEPGEYSYELQVTYPLEETFTWVFGNFQIQITS